MTNIQWTERTWNPMRGCWPHSPGCLNCYAAREAYRLAHNPNPAVAEKYGTLAVLRHDRPGWSGERNFDFATLAQAFTWRRPTVVFVNSMSDVFWEKFTNEEIAALFGVMGSLPHVRFQVLTKRAVRMVEWFAWAEAQGDAWAVCVRAATDLWHANDQLPPKILGLRQAWPLHNVWLGVSAEDQERLEDRAPLLMMAPAALRWVSCEPLLSELDLGRWLQGPAPKLDWVVVGGESGPGARGCSVTWLHRVVADCAAAGTPVFVKQLGARPYDAEPAAVVPVKHKKGGEPKEWPEALRVRQWPTGTSAAAAPPPVPLPPPPPPPPRAVLTAVGRRCTALFGREATIGWWRQAKLPLLTASEDEVQAALPALEAFRARAEAFARLDGWARILRLRGRAVEVPVYWPQMDLRTIEAKAETLRQQVVATSPEGPDLLGPGEVEALAVRVSKVGEIGSGLREARFRPGLPLDVDDVRRAFATAYGALVLDVSNDDDGLVVYRLKVNQD